MRFPPLAVILSWPTPNYVDPPTRGPAILIVNVILTFFLTVLVIGRFYSRIFIRRWLGWDDWMMIPAFIFSVCMAAVVCLANMRYGWDRHLWDIPLSLVQSANIIAFIAKINFTAASTFTRLSLLCFYYRLIKDSGVRWFKWILHASLVWTACVGISFVALTIWLCEPVQCYWIFPPTAPCRCLNEGKVLVGGGVANCFTDALVTLLPIPIVMQLQLPLKQRIGICFLLSMGIIVTVAGAIRTYYSWKGLMDSWDETWWTYPLWLAAAVEIELAAMCACAPAWKALMQQPLRDLSAKWSSLRSRRTTSATPDPNQKPSMFSPIRSLPWFQLKSLHFTNLHSSGTDTSAEAEPEDQELGHSIDSPFHAHSNSKGTFSAVATVPLQAQQRLMSPTPIYEQPRRNLQRHSVVMAAKEKGRHRSMSARRVADALSGGFRPPANDGSEIFEDAGDESDASKLKIQVRTSLEQSSVHEK